MELVCEMLTAGFLVSDLLLKPRFVYDYNNSLSGNGNHQDIYSEDSEDNAMES